MKNSKLSSGKGIVLELDNRTGTLQVLPHVLNMPIKDIQILWVEMLELLHFQPFYRLLRVTCQIVTLNLTYQSLTGDFTGYLDLPFVKMPSARRYLLGLEIADVESFWLH